MTLLTLLIVAIGARALFGSGTGAGTGAITGIGVPPGSVTETGSGTGYETGDPPGSLMGTGSETGDPTGYRLNRHILWLGFGHRLGCGNTF